MKWLRWALPFVLLLMPARAGSESAKLTADQIVARLIESDPWGLSGGRIQATAILTDRRGSKRELSFVAASKQHDPPLSKSIVRFSAPPDLAGAGFLQIQNRDRDDDRYLFLPALKRARRISGGLRSSAFMGTDFSFADLDRRDLRESIATMTGTEKVGRSTCYVLDVTPTRPDTEYSHIEVWVRTDNFMQLRMRMYDKSRVLMKTFEAREVRRVRGKWFLSKSVMTNHRSDHTTLLVLRGIAVDSPVPDEEFSVRALERP